MVRNTRSFILLVLSLSWFVCGTPALAETVRGTGQGHQSAPSSSDPLAPFLGNPGRTASAAPAPQEGAVPIWSGRQEASSESKLGWALWEMTQKTGEAARTVKDSVKTSITDYVKDKQRQSRQQDLVQKFHTNLQYVSANLRLAPRDYQELTTRVQRVYVEDAESGRYEFDSLHFRELPYIVRREYAEMVLERTENGEVETYHLNGEIKTHWHLKNGQPDGPIVTYYENGDINFIDVFKEGKKIRRTKYDEEGKLVFEQKYDYSLPDEKEVIRKQESFSEKKERPEDSPKQSKPATPAAFFEEDPAEAVQKTEPSDFVELPPHISAHRIEV